MAKPDRQIASLLQRARDNQPISVRQVGSDEASVLFSSGFSTVRLCADQSACGLSHLSTYETYMAPPAVLFRASLLGHDFRALHAWRDPTYIERLLSGVPCVHVAESPLQTTWNTCRDRSSIRGLIERSRRSSIRWPEANDYEYVFHEFMHKGVPDAVQEVVARDVPLARLSALVGMDLATNSTRVGRFYLGAALSGTQFVHWHAATINLLVAGCKLWLVSAFDGSAVGGEYHDKNPLARFAVAKNRTVQQLLREDLTELSSIPGLTIFLQWPGELVYLPHKVPHAVINLEWSAGATFSWAPLSSRVVQDLRAVILREMNADETKGSAQEKLEARRVRERAFTAMRTRAEARDQTILARERAADRVLH
jgi:hypothetical protein